jgi:hypothetical protein
MATFFLIVSAVLFIGTFGIYIQNSGNRRVFDQPLIFSYPGMKAVPWVCGFILPVIPFALVFPYHWAAIFILNIPLVYIAGPLLTNAILVRIKSPRGHVFDMINTLIGGIITLIIGIIIK